MTQTSNTFQIQTEIFTGPLDLLLHLIEKRKLLINDISLAKITDDYIQYIHEHEMKLGDASQFVLIASTLLLIKSKSLLPTLELTEEEQTDMSNLELRLKLYKRIKEAGEGVSAEFGKHILFQTEGLKTAVTVFAPSQKTTLAHMKETINSLIQHLPKKEVLQKATIKKIISLEEMMDRLVTRITSNLKMSFREFSGSSDRASVIVSFLAMLELVKQNTIKVDQNERYSDMNIESRNISVPNYM